MTFPNPFSTKTAGVTSIGATEVNNAGVSISRAVDGAGGGAYTLSSPLSFAGSTYTISSDTVLSSVSSLTMSGTAKIFLASRSITRVSPYIPTSLRIGGVDGWESQGGGRFTCITAAGELYYPVRVPHNAKVTAFSVYHTGSGPHAGAPTMPSVNLFRYALTGASSSLASATETWVDDATYGATHALTKSGINVAIDRSLYRYAVVYKAESGGNFVAGDLAGELVITYTITEMDED
jgi:hypothetical protein